jgi:hypothetical protein
MERIFSKEFVLLICQPLYFSWQLAEKMPKALGRERLEGHS